jgi:hypothetical protein
MRQFAHKQPVTQRARAAHSKQAKAIYARNKEWALTSSSSATVPRGHDFGRIPIHPQKKIAIGQPEDEYEREADRVAEIVLRKPEQRPHLGHEDVYFFHRGPGREIVQRLAAHESPALEDATVAEEEEEEKAQTAVQTLRSQPHQSGTAGLSALQLQRSQGGSPLQPGLGQFMETRFGVDFSRVRIHDDSNAAVLSRSLQARAFTYGDDIYFGQGEYQPETHEGKRVLAHELTHVIQQGFGEETANHPSAIQRLSKRGTRLRDRVQPWGPDGPTGSDFEIKTDGGSVVTGWQAYMVFRDELRYWCHGHTFGSYVDDDYSVYSGSSTATVIADEWANIPPDQTRTGDIAVWTAGYNHSAIFTSPVVTNGQLSPDQSRLSTKNGQRALTSMTLTQLAGIYGPAGVAVFRHR